MSGVVLELGSPVYSDEVPGEQTEPFGTWCCYAGAAYSCLKAQGAWSVTFLCKINAHFIQK